MDNEADEEYFDLEETPEAEYQAETDVVYQDENDVEKPADYQPVTTNPLAPYQAPAESGNYIDTSIPMAHSDVPSYETVDQIKYKINKEIQQTRTTPTPPGPEFIIYAWFILF